MKTTRSRASVAAQWARTFKPERIDNPGMVELAQNTTKASNDCMDEIHATPEGGPRLAATAWNPTLAKILA